MTVSGSQRWFTCTPVEFCGAEEFFVRDSGLLSRGFRSIGVESMAVMPGARKDKDLDELIRTDFRNLESAEWWKSHHLDGVVLYAWGRPKFRKVAAAIREAGVFLVLNQDNGGLVSPLVGAFPWIREQWNLSGQGRDIRSYFRLLKLVIRGLSLGLAYTDPFRAIHLKSGDCIACVSPIAADCYRKLCRIYGGEDLSKKVTVIPHSVEPDFSYDGREKIQQIVCVGRWEDLVQKRTYLLTEILEKLLPRNESVRAVIAGNPTPFLIDWHSRLSENEKSRIELKGFVDHAGLVELMRESRIFYSPSAYESFGIAAAEALCAGCSVVAGESVSMASFNWFVSTESGELAKSDHPEAHLEALNRELAKWEDNLRNPREISKVWCERLHAPNVAKQVLALVDLNKS